LILLADGDFLGTLAAIAIFLLQWAAAKNY